MLWSHKHRELQCRHEYTHKKIMTKKWSDAYTRKGRRYATPNCRGFIYAPRDLSLLRREGSLSLLFSALFNDRPASFFLINTPPQPPNPSAKITTSFTDKNVSLSIYWSLSLSSIAQPVTEYISWAVSAKNNYFICFQLTREVCISSTPSPSFGRKQPSSGSLLNGV